jgi:hypothetical protein
MDLSVIALPSCRVPSRASLLRIEVLHDASEFFIGLIKVVRG